MGDIINTLPLLKTLKETYPGCFITLLCYREFSALFCESPVIDRFLRLQIGEITRAATFDELGNVAVNPYPELLEEYDIVINLGFDVWPAMICTKLKALTKYGRISSKKEEIRLLGDWMKYLFSFIHNRDYNLFSIVDIFTRSGGVPNREVSGYLPVTPEQTEKASLLLKENGLFNQETVLIAFQLGASEPLRAWEIEKFVQLGHLLKKFNPQIEILLIGSPSETALAEEFLRQFTYKAINLVGITEIQELPAVLTLCHLLISNDTGPIHIAGAVGTKVLGIYFASAYFAETGPYGSGHVIVQAEMPCHPCADYCVCPHMECRQYLTAEIIALVAKGILTGKENLEFNYPHLSLYRSRFLENGSLIYAPFPGSTIAPEFIKGLLYRFMWESETDMPVYCQFVAPLKATLKNSPVYNELLNTFATELDTLLEIFAIGITACDGLLVMIRKPGVTAQDVAAPMNQLNIIEGFLDKREEPLSPIKHFFSFVIMDMDYLQLPALAIELKKKYQKLQGMSNSFLKNLLTVHHYLND